jgi:hypothetical protein
MYRGAADLRHHHFGCGGGETLNQDGILRIARHDVVLAAVHVAGRVRMLAKARMYRID